MILLVSGEGPSDIGKTDVDGKFEAGPMYWLVDKIVGPIWWNSSPFEDGAVKHLDEGELSELCKSNPKLVALRGKKRPNKGTAIYAKHARALVKKAQELEKSEGQEVASILFRDADGTQSTVKGMWEEKHEAIEMGLLLDDYDRGIPMVPKPKSECWLLCAIQDHAYTNCADLENISGNDKSPNSAKKLLDQRMNEMGHGGFDLEALNDAVNDGSIDAQAIDMPSYNVFKARLEEVAKTMVGKPTT